MKLTALLSSSKRDQVVHLLRDAILGGELVPGERIVESRIARQLRISQAPIREALALLERQGLVVKVHNRGTFVSRVHGRELHELFTLRAVLDAFSARLAASKATSKDVQDLRRLLARMRTAEEAGDLVSLTDAHLQLHEAIYRLSGHGLLTEIFAQIHPRMALALTFAENLFSSEGHETDCHVPLIDAIAAHDAERAEAIARELALGWIDQVVVEEKV
ncbi:MAG TPA: GntR family transcriptional regulator [Aestuariivirgaceae bacterium]|jgi:DNA-binding GntR family transcriptional regulator